MFEECKIEGDFTLSSGKKSNVFYDFDLLSPSQMLAYIDKLCLKLPLPVLKFDYVVAPAIGGIIPGWVIAGELGKKFLTVDKEGKVRGGTPSADHKYLIVDDVISSYGTAKRIAAALPLLQCVGIAAFIFRGDKMIKNTFVLEHKEIEV